MRLLIIFLFSFLSFSQLKILQKKDRVNLSKEVSDSVSVKSSAEDKYLEMMRRRNSSLEKQLKKLKNQSVVFDFTNKFKIPSGTAIRAKLLNSIVSTNIESPILVKVGESKEFPSGAKFLCRGITQNFRVISACDKVVVGDQEYEVQVSLLNRDGSAGIKGTVIDYRDEFIASKLATGFARGLVEISQARIPTEFGDLPERSRENRLLQAGLGTIDAASEIIESDYEQLQPVVMVNAGVELIVFFNGRFES